MSAWHLLWIIPVAYIMGFITCSLFVVGAAADREMEERDEDD